MIFEIATIDRMEISEHFLQLTGGLSSARMNCSLIESDPIRPINILIDTHDRL